jgi:hypothetical protein
MENARVTLAYRTIAAILTILALSAQTPAGGPQPGTIGGPPLRHLEYGFSVDYQTTGQVDTGAIGASAGVGRASYFGGTGRQGTMSIDILAAAHDGGLVVRASEWIDNQPRASQPFVCAVYPDTRVICPQELPVTDAETILMTFMGRGFVDPSLIDANNHWQRHYDDKFVSVVADFTVASTDSSGKIATIDGVSKTSSLNGANRNWIDTSKFQYDLSMEVPTQVHMDSEQSVRGVVGYKATFDYHLKKDSLAKTQ